MVRISLNRDELEAYNRLPTSEKSNHEISILNNRLRLLPVDQIPFLKDMQNFFGRSVFILDKKSSDTEVHTAKSNSTVSTTNTDDSEDNGEGPLRFEFFSLSKMMKGFDRSAGRRLHMFTNIEYFDCNPMETDKAMELRYHFKGPNDPDGPNIFHIKEPLLIFTDAKDALSTTFVYIAYEKAYVVSGLARFLGRWDTTAEKSLISLSHRFDRLHYVSKATAFLSTPAPERRFIGSRPSQMSMKFYWASNVAPTSYLTTPASTSKVIVCCTPGWKDPRVSLFEETCVLEHLLCIALTLRDGTPMIWPRSDDRNESVIPRVKTLIEQCSLTRQDPMDKRFFDFTEQLFDILRFCTTHEILVEALKIVFNALRAAKINTLLHADNKSTLARLIRDSLAGELNLPRLEAMTVLQILLEIGVERFRRDMIHKFVDEKLVVNTEEFMLQYMEQGCSAEENALKLLPLHMALVTIMELTKYLSMNDHSLSILRKKVIAEYTKMSIENNTLFNFETSVLFTDVNPNVLKLVKPSLWMNEVVYSSKPGAPPVARTFTHFTRDINISYLEDMVNVNGMETDEKTAQRGSQYVCTLFTASYNRRDLKIFS